MEEEPTPEEKGQAEATKSLLKAIRAKKKIIVATRREEQDKNHAALPRRRLGINPSAARAHLASLGLPAEAAESMLASAGAGAGAGVAAVPAHAGHKRGRSPTRRGAAAGNAGRGRDDFEDEDDDMGMGGDEGEGGPSSAAAASASSFARKRARSSSRHRALSAGAGVHTAAQEVRLARDKSRERAFSVVPQVRQADTACRLCVITLFLCEMQRDGLANPAAKRKAVKLNKKTQRLDFRGTQGESDRHIGVKLPKWLNSGKRGIGKTDRR